MAIIRSFAFDTLSLPPRPKRWRRRRWRRLHYHYHYGHSTLKAHFSYSIQFLMFVCLFFSRHFLFLTTVSGTMPAWNVWKKLRESMQGNPLLIDIDIDMIFSSMWWRPRPCRLSLLNQWQTRTPPLSFLSDPFCGWTPFFGGLFFFYLI